jgi:hypothetical protein
MPCGPDLALEQKNLLAMSAELPAPLSQSVFADLLNDQEARE